MSFSNRSSLRKSKSDSRNLHKTGERIPQSIVNNEAFSFDEKEFEDRLGNKDDSDYWSTPSSSIRYRKSTLTYLIYSKRLLTLNILKLEKSIDSLYFLFPILWLDETEDDVQALSFEENHFYRTSSAQKFRRSFQKYTGTVIRSPLDRINGVNPPRRLLRNVFIDGCDIERQDCNNVTDMIELSPIKDETKSVDTCSTTTNVSTKEPSYVVVIWKVFVINLLLNSGIQK